MDKLLHSAKRFQQLLEIEYKFVLGRKGKLYCFTLSFEPHDFHHLAGLHKLEDLSWLRKNRERIFKDILLQKISYADIKASTVFDRIQSRIENLGRLQELLDNQDTVFIWLKNKTKYSNIDADYLIVCKNHNNTFYLFVKKEVLDKVRPISFFARTNQDYTQGQIRTTLLKKVKINKGSNSKNVLIDHMNPSL